MSTPIRPVALKTAEVIAWLEKSLRDPTSSQPQLEVIERRDNPSSTHWVVFNKSHHASTKIFVKQHITTDLYEQERNALSKLSPYSNATEPFAVPAMLAHSDNLSCIALEWLEGESIGPVIRNSVGRVASPAARALGSQLAFRVGKWLQKLATRTRCAASSLPAEEMHVRFLELLRMIDSGNSALLPKGKSAELLKLFEQCLGDATPEEDCLVHNDFWFDHIWTVGDQLVVIDFGRARIGPAGRDAIQFYCRLLDIATFNPMVSKRARDKIIGSFIAGYGTLDAQSRISILWQLWTRAEQLAGLTEYVPADLRDKLTTYVRQKALVQQLTQLCS